MHAVLMVLGLSVAVAAEPEPCAADLTVQDISGLVVQAEQAFSSLDAESFRSAAEGLSQLDCVREPFTTLAAGGWFRVRALDAHLNRAPDDLMANAAAFAELVPGPPSSTFAPRGHPIRNAWEQAREVGPSPTKPLEVPLGGRLRIDGRDTLDLPLSRPSLVQFTDEEGRVSWTRLVQPGEQAPSYQVAPEDFREDYLDRILVSKPRKPVELPILAGVGAAGAVGTFIASYATRQRYLKGTPGQADLKQLKTSTNALSVASGTLGVAAVGFGVWTAVKW